MQVWPSSPSFNSYSSSSSVNLTEIAARVVEEFREVGSENKAMESKQDDDDDDDDGGIKEEDEFEFAFVYNKKQETPPISADEIFFNGQIKPLCYDNNNINHHHQHPLFDNRPKIRKPLGELMREDREINETVYSLSCSSSAADDLDSLQPGTYCVWNPEASFSFSNNKESSRSRRSNNNKKKRHSSSGSSSSSSSSSKRWNKLREFLLYRSNSEGKDTFVFLTPTDS